MAKSANVLVIGWPERDDKNVSRVEKVFGSASMRVDVHVKRIFLACGGDSEMANRWMRRFYEAGWRGRPAKDMSARWGVMEVSGEELGSKIHGIMRYQPAPGMSCINGRPGDEERIVLLLEAIRHLLDDLKRTNSTGA